MKLSHWLVLSDGNHSATYRLMRPIKLSHWLVCTQRNPNVKFYGLPWTFPGWVGGGVFNPFINRTATVRYILNWINGAWNEHQLRISYIGVSLVTGSWEK